MTSSKSVDKIRVKVFNQENFLVIPNALISLQIVFDKSGSKKILSTLKANKFGYLSFDIKKYHPQINIDEISDLQLVYGTGESNNIEYSILGDIKKLGDHVINLNVDVNKINILTTNINGVLSIESPDVDDWQHSPGSFAENKDRKTGDGACEDLYLSDHSIQEYRHRTLIRKPKLSKLTKVPNSDSYLANFEKFNHSNWTRTVITPDKLEVEVRSGYINEYKTTWNFMGHSLGQILYSLPLAPCESVKLAVIDWSRNDIATRNEKTEFGEQLDHELRRDRNIEDTMTTALQESMTSVTASTQFGFTGFGASGGVSYGTSSQNSQAKAAQDLMDKVVQAASSLRSINSTVVVQASQAESERIETRTVTNHNHCHSLTVMYYEVLKHYLVKTEWVKKIPVVLIPHPVKEFNQNLAFCKRHILKEVLLDKDLKDAFNYLELQDTDVVPVTSSSNNRSLGNNLQKIKFTITLKSPVSTRDKYTVALNFVIKLKAEERPGANSQRRKYLVLRWSEKVDISGEDNTVEFVTDLINAKIGYQEFTQNIYNSNDFSNIDNFTQVDLTPEKTLVSILELEKFQILSFGSNKLNQYGTYDNDSYTDLISEINGFRIEVLTDSTDTFKTAITLFPKESNDSKWQVFDENTLKSIVGLPPAISSSSSGYVIQVSKNTIVDQLLGHLNCNRHYYNRMLWLYDDPELRTLYLDGLRNGDISLLDVVMNEPLGIQGDSIIYPLTHIEEIRDSDEPLEVVSKIISFPTKGVFAESKLGHCNSCEERDPSKYWDWKESPCDCDQTPEIAPISSGSRYQQPNVNPTNFPSNVLNVVNPPPAPEYSGLDNATKVMTSSQLADKMKLVQNSNLPDNLKNDIISNIISPNKNNYSNSKSLSDAAYDAAQQGRGVKTQKTDSDGNSELIEISGNDSSNVFKLYYDIPNLAQTKLNDCWLVAATVLLRWKDKVNYSPLEVLKIGNNKFLSKYLNDAPLLASEKTEFLTPLGLVGEPPANYTIDTYKSLLINYGPVWITTSSNTSNSFSPHARILKGISTDGTPQNTTFTFIDTSDGKESVEPFNKFLEQYERMVTQNSGELFIQIVRFDESIAGEGALNVAVSNGSSSTPKRAIPFQPYKASFQVHPLYESDLWNPLDLDTLQNTIVPFAYNSESSKPQRGGRLLEKVVNEILLDEIRYRVSKNVFSQIAFDVYKDEWLKSLFKDNVSLPSWVRIAKSGHQVVRLDFLNFPATIYFGAEEQEDLIVLAEVKAIQEQIKLSTPSSTYQISGLIEIANQLARAKEVSKPLIALFTDADQNLSQEVIDKLDDDNIIGLHYKAEYIEDNDIFYIKFTLPIDLDEGGNWLGFGANTVSEVRDYEIKQVFEVTRNSMSNDINLEDD